MVHKIGSVSIYFKGQNYWIRMLLISMHLTGFSEEHEKRLFRLNYPERLLVCYLVTFIHPVVSGWNTCLVIVCANFVKGYLIGLSVGYILMRLITEVFCSSGPGCQVLQYHGA